MEEFIGTYLGFSPADESAVGLGEFEVVVSEDKIRYRLATGLAIHEGESPMSDFTAMTPEESAALWGESAGTDIASRTAGFKTLFESPQLFFIRNPRKNECALFIRMGMADMLGPTFLFNSVQVESGSFEKALLYYQEFGNGPGCVPRLRNNGKAERD